MYPGRGLSEKKSQKFKVITITSIVFCHENILSQEENDLRVCSSDQNTQY